MDQSQSQMEFSVRPSGIVGLKRLLVAYIQYMQEPSSAIALCVTLRIYIRTYVRTHVLHFVKHFSSPFVPLQTPH